MKDLQAIFIDRDGTMGGTGHFCHPKEFTVFPFTVEAIALLKDMGLHVFAFTNQHRISQGMATVEDFVEEFSGYGINHVYVCPHSLEEDCVCKKPNPGMLVNASREHGLDLSRCVVIGDVGGTDMLAAHKVGALKILVKTGWGLNSLTTYRDTWVETEPDYIANDLYDAVMWIKKYVSSCR
jgi:histidinol-phosphate phosphatase family protein